ncbi:dipeptidylpeptidase [Entomortierella beljakovae]|nr:dipeptidylpeptidase [Entomortierella beljakovae]
MTSWYQCRNEVRSLRSSLQPTIATIRDVTFDSDRDRIYFMSNDLTRSSKSPMLFRVDLPQSFSPSGSTSETIASTTSIPNNEFVSDLNSNSEVTQDKHCSAQNGNIDDLHKHSTNKSEEEEDHDMDLVPFHPDSYQNFISPASLSIQITSCSRESTNASISATPISTLSSNAYTNRYPHQAYTVETSSSAMDQVLASAPVLDWTPVLSDEWLKYCNTHGGHTQSDRLSSYQYEPQENKLLFPYGAAIYTTDIQEDGKVNPKPARSEYSTTDPSHNKAYSNLVHSALTAGLDLVSVSGPLTTPRSPMSGLSTSNLDKISSSSGVKADPKLGGMDRDLISFTRDQDIWVMTTSGVETQLTFCSRNKAKSDISCGIAEFVMQEEFYRYTNYYWAPSARSHQGSHFKSTPKDIPQPFSTPPTYQQYENESQFSSSHSTTVSPVSISPSSSPVSSPSPSIPNELPVPATSRDCSNTMMERILYLQVSEAMVDLVVIPRAGLDPEYEEYRYPRSGTTNAVSDLQIVEFIPRRHEDDIVPEPLHKRLWGRASLYKLFSWLEYIVRFGWWPDGESVWVQILDRRQQITAIVLVPLDCFMSVTEQSESSDQTEDEIASRIRIIYEEQSDYWINVSDIMYIFSTESDNGDSSHKVDDTVKLIVASERTGFRHLYLVTHSTQSGSTITPITSGQYQITDKQIAVDTTRQLVYFTAKRDSVLESHLYVASFAHGAQTGTVKRLTELGFSHQAVVDLKKNRFLTSYSSIDQSPSCAVLHLRWGNCTYKGEMRSDGQNRKWCMCGCQFPKISSHAYILKEGIVNMAAKDIRNNPIVGAIPQQGHMRSFSESSMNPSRIDAALNGLRSGSMNSISGFLASHLLSTSLLPSSKVFTQQHHESNMILGPSNGNKQRPSLKFSQQSHSSTSSTQRPSSSSSSSTSTSTSTSSSSSPKGTVINASHHPVGEFFTFTSSDKVQLHGCLYRPANYVVGQKYSTLVSIYGGPRSQTVTNEYKLPKLARVFMASRLGFAVVMIDGRGSGDRGLKFEGHLRHQMGQIEIRDQVEGLEFLARPENGGIVDMEHVAISGWSYGGYLSLMAIAQYPDIFKLAIAGAPVTQWELYNTAYTERYMGLVQENKEGYSKSNVVNWVDKFPDGENRLLVAHGLIDENVHFKNSESLIAELIRQNKPHHLQVYPTERHGLRDSRTNEHFETLMFQWLKTYL